MKLCDELISVKFHFEKGSPLFFGLNAFFCYWTSPNVQCFAQNRILRNTKFINSQIIRELSELVVLRLSAHVFLFFFVSLPQKTESWESEKREEDMEFYDWDRNSSKNAYISLKSRPGRTIESNVPNLNSFVNDADLFQYKEAVSHLFNEGIVMYMWCRYL